MALSFSLGLRAARANAISTFAGSTVRLRLYSGTRPAVGDAATTYLVELIATTSFAPTTSTAVLTLNSFNQGDVAVAGTASWFRIVKSDGSTTIMDGSVSFDLGMTSTVLSQGGKVSFVSMTITEGNA